MTSRWRGARTGWRAAASALAAVALLSACGEGGDEEGGGEAAPRAPGTELLVSFRATAGAEPVEATLRCDPVGGSHPRRDEACADLAADPGALAPPPADAVCTQIFGGPETATVEGVVRGRGIEASFSRENGCEIARWDALDRLLRLESG